MCSNFSLISYFKRRAYIIVIDDFVSFGHKISRNLSEHLNIPLDIVPETSNHVNFVFFVKVELKVFETDFESFSLSVGDLLLS
jgi:hypothetical protein